MEVCVEVCWGILGGGMRWCEKTKRARRATEGWEGEDEGEDDAFRDSLRCQ